MAKKLPFHSGHVRDSVNWQAKSMSQANLSCSKLQLKLVCGSLLCIVCFTYKQECLTLNGMPSEYGQVSTQPKVQKGKVRNMYGRFRLFILYCMQLEYSGEISSKYARLPLVFDKAAWPWGTRLHVIFMVSVSMIITLVLEDRVIRDIIKDIIKYLWIDMKFLPKQHEAMFLMLNQYVKLRSSYWRLIGLLDYMCPLDLITQSIDGVLEPVIRHSKVIRKYRTTTKRIWSCCHMGKGGEGELEDRLMVSSSSEVVDSEFSESELKWQLQGG
jgi:hypothetical protein